MVRLVSAGCDAHSMPSSAPPPPKPSFWPDTAEGFLILVLGVAGLVMIVVGLVLGGPLLPVVIGLVIVVAFLMGGNLSVFSVGKRGLNMQSRASSQRRTR